MKKEIVNYTVFIERQKRTGTQKACYMAFVPNLGIATEADTLERVEKEIKSLIQFHLDSLALEKEPIPAENKGSFITQFNFILPKGAILA